MVATATQIFQLPLSSSHPSFSSGQRNYGVCSPSPVVICRSSGISVEGIYGQRKNRRFGSVIAQQEKGDATEIKVPVPLTLEQQEKEKQNRDDEEEEEEEGDVDPEDLKYVNEIKRVCDSFVFCFCPFFRLFVIPFADLALAKL